MGSVRRESQQTEGDNRFHQPRQNLWEHSHHNSLKTGITTVIFNDNLHRFFLHILHPNFPLRLCWQRQNPSRGNLSLKIWGKIILKITGYPLWSALDS
jgi:hypothetical protein